MSEPWLIRAGVCHAILIHDVGFSIDIEAAAGKVEAAQQRYKLARERRAPRYFDFDPAPLMLAEGGPALPVGRRTTQPQVEVIVFDFGAVAVRYRITLDGSLADLRDLSGSLWDAGELRDDARARVQRLVQQLGPSIEKPQLREYVEDYIVYQIEGFAGGATRPDLDEPAVRQLLAQILRVEDEPLSDEEVADALGCRISYTPRDETLIDWNAAMMFGPQSDDVLAVLEFANAELLELRQLDDQLDRSLERSYGTIRRRARLGAFGSAQADLRQIAEMQMDAAMLFEGVDNALKLVGDPYLARVYQRACQRLHHGDWDASIFRKLSALESIHDKLANQLSDRRIEFLEIIIILLIAVEILMGLAA